MNKQNISLLSLFILFAFNLHAFEETTFLTQMKKVFNEPKACANGDSSWQIKSITVPRRTHSIPTVSNPFGRELKDNKEKYLLRYSIYGCKLGKNGSIVIIPGRGEGSPEFFETALEFIHRGFSPIYVMDPRGQGLSPRLLDMQKGHLENFNHYLSDLNLLIKEVKTDLAKRNGEDQDLFYLSNSMGAGIGLGHFMQKNSQPSPFKAAAMLGPMIRINYLAFNKKNPTWLNDKIYSENGALLIATLFCSIGKCDGYADKKNFSDYRPGTRKFIPQNEDKMTHSKTRYDYKTYLLDEFDWSGVKNKFYEKGEKWNNLIIGGATYNWVLTTTYFLKHMKSKKGIQELQNIPFNLIAGENDNRIYRPYLDGSHDLSRIKGYCQDVNKYNSFQRDDLCQLNVIKNGFHELLKEKDSIRLDAIESAVKFFLKHKTKLQSINASSL